MAYSIEYAGRNVNCIPQSIWMMEGPNGKILEVGLSRKEGKLIGSEDDDFYRDVELILPLKLNKGLAHNLEGRILRVLTRAMGR